MQSFLLILFVTGGIALFVWRQNVQLTVFVTTILLLVAPWPFVTFPYVGSGHVLVPFVVLLLGSGLQLAVRSRTQVRRAYHDTDVHVALVVGVIHLAIGSGLQLYARQDVRGAIPILLIPLFGLVLVSAGAAPVLLWTRKRLVSPALVVSGWLLWGIYKLWEIRHVLPRTAFTGIAFTRLAPHKDYLFQSTMLLVVLLAALGIEVGLRQLTSSVRHRFAARD
jgi:hypothetical protein